MKKLIRITTVPISLDKLLGKQLTFMSQYYDLTAISADKEELQRIAQKYGVKNHHVEMTREISPAKDLVAVWKLYKYLKKEKPFIVHSHTPKAGIVGMMAAYFAGVPNRLHTIAGLPLLEAAGFKRKVLIAVEKLTYAFATKVYPNSFVLKDFLVKENFCFTKKIKVLGNGSSNGINTSFFNSDQISEQQKQKLRKDLGISAENFVFVFVGRLVSDKGINELVAAFQQIHLDFPNSKLLLVGPLEEDLDALLPKTLQEIKENAAIIDTGFQDDVRPYFTISDALIFPSYREGFPNVVLQAGAMGLPCVVSDINGCNEIIIEGENGLIVPVKNIEELKKTMLKILKDKDIYQHLKKNSRSRIEENYEQSVVWQAILEEYRNTENNV